jgi:DHA2 family multidrug resistance protein
VIDLRLFSGRNFTGGTIAIAVGYGVFFGNLVLLPQWMQQDLGYPSINAGLVTAPLGIFAVMLSPVIGRFLPKVDARIVVTIAFLLFSLVFYMRSLYTVDVDTWALVLPTLIQGIPMVMFFIPLTVIILSGLPPEKIPSAAGLSNFARVFCGAIGTSIATTFWSNRSILHHTQLTEQATPYTDNFMAFSSQIQMALNGGPGTQNVIFNRLVNVQADTLGINDIFAVSSIIFILLIPLVWITKPAHVDVQEVSSGAH